MQSTRELKYPRFFFFFYYSYDRVNRRMHVRVLHRRNTDILYNYHLPFSSKHAVSDTSERFSDRTWASPSFRLNIDRRCTVSAGSDATNALCTLLRRAPDNLGRLVYRCNACQLYRIFWNWSYKGAFSWEGKTE